MNLKQSIDKILHQWPAKVICLIIAIFIYIFHQVSLIDKKTFVVPLSIQENGLVMHISQVPNSVAVVVRTSSDNMKLISLNDINASINLDTIVEKGVYELPVNIIISDSIKALDPLEIRLKDDKISLEVDKKVFKYVPVQPTIVGEVSHGYYVDTVTVNPSTVKIYGPEFMVNSIDKVFTNRINVSNAEVSFSNETDIQNLNKVVSIEKEEQYSVDISVIPILIEKEFDVPVEIVNVRSNLNIETNISSVKIKLAGPMNSLENYNVPRRSTQAYAGDIFEPGTYELPLRFYFPTNMEILEKSDEVITIVVTDKNFEAIEKEQEDLE